ncbi:MAG: phospholipase D-like domain-containing protein [Firmicutes bacterium]|nr:phospholipase D-like domain-containing protein [Bacillota bacterium]
MSSGLLIEKERNQPVETRSKTKNSIGRGLFAAASMILQVVWVVLAMTFFKDSYVWIDWLIQAAAVCMVLHIYAKRENICFKLPWIMLILAFPILGVAMYGMVEHSGTMKKMRLRYRRIDACLLPLLPDSTDLINQVEKEDLIFANMARSIQDAGAQPRGYPLYAGTDAVYYADAMEGLVAQVEELKKAEHFILMEYHAIEDGQGFAKIHEVLKEKAAAGVEINLIYDDLGSIGFVDRAFREKLNAEGIHTRVFNPVSPILGFFQNNRDHRKITVIDGRVGFTGGYNLADEYFHYKEPYGRWKDSGVKLTGDAVLSLMEMFEEMWNAIDPEKGEDFIRFFPRKSAALPGAHGYVQPYADSPMDSVLVGEDVYMNLINAAQKYIWFTTPYLVITEEMKRMLILAARRGVDVRIITPGIPDKKLVYNVTRSYYGELVDGGVRIFEYTPGFIHTKDCLCDGRYAACGTINLDFRSFYHHFEDGVLMMDTPAVGQIRADFLETFDVSKEVTQDYRNRTKITPTWIWRLILRLFSPLM